MGIHQVFIQTPGPSNKVLLKMGVCEKLDVVAVKERFICSQDEGKSAFEELAVYACQLETAICEKQELAKTKIAALKECNCKSREKLSRLRAKYCALLELYNKFAAECEEEAKAKNLPLCRERSDSSSSEEEEDDDCDDNCFIM